MPDSLDELKTRLERAFLPYRCEVKFWDFEERIKFAVTDATGSVLYRDDEVLVQDLMDEIYLESCIHAVKGHIAEMRGGSGD